jgi:hypothetical protein
LKKNIGPSVPDRERAVAGSFGDTAIDWQGAAPSWSAMFLGIVLPMVVALATLAAATIVLYFLISGGLL